MRDRAALAPPVLQTLAKGQLEAQELEFERINDEAAEGTYQYLLRAGFQASTPPSTFSAGTAEANARLSLLAHVRDVSRHLVSNGLLLLQHASRAIVGVGPVRPHSNAVGIPAAHGLCSP